LEDLLNTREKKKELANKKQCPKKSDTYLMQKKAAFLNFQEGNLAGGRPSFSWGNQKIERQFF